ncbi:MAG: sigma 54-interacting transcriptional regulator [candidate division KSB1 bacterium]|nr:sigma 54-interacting transcriptional regulator [candidate division KSB1 bacterium]MDZ7301296.1 sigma 54-interacting transcriptional regulator [candidate division KSB1 bacterium]
MSESRLKKRRWGVKIALGACSIFLPLLLFHTLGFLEAFELQFLDFMQKSSKTRKPSSEIILITVDDQTTSELHALPLRQYCAQTVRALSHYGPRVFIFDFLFLDEGIREADAELVNVTKEFGNVIHTMHFGWWDDHATGERTLAPSSEPAYAKYSVRPRNEADLKFVRGDSARFPHPFFLTNFDKAGLISVFSDPDGRTRRIPLFFQHRDLIYPALSLVALGEYLHAPLDSIHIKKNFWGYHLEFQTPQKALTIPINRRGQMLLNLYGELGTFKSYSVLQIRKALQDLEEKKAPRVPLNDFTGKIVIVGSIETGVDVYSTVFTPNFPGMGLQATAISNFLNGDALWQLPWYVDAGVVLFLALLLSVGLMLAGRINKTWETIYGWIFLGLIIFAFNLWAYFFLFKGLHIAPAMLKINSTIVLLFLTISFYEKSLRVKILNREVRKLENDIKDKLAHIDLLNTKISERDEQYKTVAFFVSEIERILNHPSVHQPEVFATPLLKMQIIQEQLKNELDRHRAEKQMLEAEKEALASQIAVYKGLVGGEKKVERVPPPSPQKKFEEVKRVMEAYKMFVQRAKVPYHYDSAFDMVTAPAPSRLGGETVTTPMQEVLAQISRIGGHDITVLITGETGTGKELVAQALRHHSNRKNGPFVILNCAAIPDTLMESELFGHVKGAFTNAISDHIGAFEQANGGTIFLDEIGDLKPEVQVKLLRVLQEKKIQRLGSSKTIPVDVRVIAATNRDLQELMRREQFRNDLYFRLDVANIHLPPLRERREEIPHLVHYFSVQFGEKHGRAKRLTEDALLAMIFYDWPGNIRELQNIVGKVYINTAGDTIRLSDLPEKIQQSYREIFVTEEIPMWEAIESATGAEMNNLLVKCRELLRAGNVEPALQSGRLTLWGESCENCYEYIKTYIDSKASLFPQDRREKLAKQTIVAMQKALHTWYKDEKLGRMEELNKELEKLLGRTRRMIDNWEREAGLPSFYSFPG